MENDKETSDNFAQHTHTQESQELTKNTEDNENIQVKEDVLYDLLSSPPWHECILLSFQHYMTLFVSSLSVPFLLTDFMCAKGDVSVKAELAGVMFFVCGISTLLQVTFGVRLPIIQSSTFSLLVPTLSYLQLPENECPLIQDNCTTLASNETCVERGSPEYEDLWKSRLHVIQGSIMIGSLLEMLLGLSGFIGFIVKFIGPLTICPTISLLGISLFKSAADYGSDNWWVCIMTLVFLVVFSQYLGFFAIPIPKYKTTDGCGIYRYPLFKMFPVILAILLSWLVCYILTVTNAIPDDPNHWGYGGRTDINSDFLNTSPWFTFFWPGKYGTPSLDIALILGLFAGFMASIVESVGDYYACARMSSAPPPPKHAINRGISIEGFGCFLAGMFGTGNGTTSISQNIGIIGLTKVASRVVIICTSLIMITFAIFNKFGALFVTLPNPIIGASFFVLFGMIVAVGISNLQFVDMNSSRNLFIFGFSFFTGLTVSEWIIANPGAIRTGWAPADSILTVLLGTSMYVGGLLGFILDNSIPGSPKARGMLHLQEETKKCANQFDDNGNYDTDTIYNIQFFGRYLNKFNWTKYIPVCPSYGKNVDSQTSRDNDENIIGQTYL